MLITAVLPFALAQALGSSLDDRIQWKAPKNISDSELTLDIKEFTNYGFGISNNTNVGRKLHVKFIEASEKRLNAKILDMMKQSMYATQDQMRALNPILEKYRNDESLRMKFIQNRLKQLVIDIRRIYTLSLRQGIKFRVLQHITLYQHCLRKHIDIIYIVEHTIDIHTKFIRSNPLVPNQQMGMLAIQ